MDLAEHRPVTDHLLATTPSVRRKLDLDRPALARAAAANAETEEANAAAEEATEAADAATTRAARLCCWRCRSSAWSTDAPRCCRMQRRAASDCEQLVSGKETR